MKEGKKEQLTDKYTDRLTDRRTDKQVKNLDRNISKNSCGMVAPLLFREHYSLEHTVRIRGTT